MFTGLITDIGTILEIDKTSGCTYKISCCYDTTTINIGASIACAGICTTVIERGYDGGIHWFKMLLSIETLKVTNAQEWQVGTKLHLERALKVGDELGGHIVNGHVDGTAEIIEVLEEGTCKKIVLQTTTDLSKFISKKGSIALDGTSLTVNEVAGNIFHINIIPHTQKNTQWGCPKVGKTVNLEIDNFARLIMRFQETQM